MCPAALARPSGHFGPPRPQLRGQPNTPPRRSSPTTSNRAALRDSILLQLEWLDLAELLKLDDAATAYGLKQRAGLTAALLSHPPGKPSLSERRAAVAAARHRARSPDRDPA